MPNVEFEKINAGLSQRGVGDKTISGLIGGLIRSGIAKDTRQANFVLMGILAASIVLSVFILIKTFSSSRVVVPTQTPDFINKMNIKK